MDSIAYIVDQWSRWVADGRERTMKYSDKQQQRSASDVEYSQRLCEHNDDVSRFNADTRGPDLCRSEGKVIILATVHDTFPRPAQTKNYWIGFDSLQTALAFRKTVCLDNAADMPVSCEYLDRDAFDVIDRAGRAPASAIKLFGTSSPIIRRFWNVKLWVEALPFAWAPVVVDKFLYTINPILPAVLPRPIMEIGRKMDHHVALTVGEFGDGNMDRLLERLDKFAAEHGSDKVVIHECKSAAALSAFRFVAAPAFRTWCVGQGVQGFSVDYALPKNGGDAPALASKPLKRMRYSHFACNVVHEDLAYGLDVDMDHEKHALKKTIERDSGGRLPAEHGHGTEYVAPRETQERWKKMDPLNVLNPGVGGLSEKFRYEE
jgi:D-lactate dehydrogenase